MLRVDFVCLVIQEICFEDLLRFSVIVQNVDNVEQGLYFFLHLQDIHRANKVKNCLVDFVAFLKHDGHRQQQAHR